MVPLNAICLQSNTKRQNTDSQSLSKQCSLEVLSGSFVSDEMCLQSNTMWKEPRSNLSRDRIECPEEIGFKWNSRSTVIQFIYVEL